MKGSVRTAFIETVAARNVASFGVQKKEIPELVRTKKEGRAKHFYRKSKDSLGAYSDLREIREERSDIYFLDREAVKVFLTDFPGSAEYVCVRAVPRLSWLLLIPGIIRRLHIGLISFEGVVSLEGEGKKCSWFVFAHHRRDTLHTRLCLSEEVGVEKFLAYLNSEKVEYVVMRFFERLPELYREGGDIDILVADEDERKIKTFLQEHSGTIGVDVWTVSRTTFNDVTYYPPPIARKILASAITGPAGSRIPSPKEAFLAFAYHVVYHKGAFSGVPTHIGGITVNADPENDYAGALERMAKEAGVEVAITLESLDTFLAEEGWRPHLDTLAKIAVKNKWVWKRFFAIEENDDLGLSVFILKKKAEEQIDSIIEEIRNASGFKVVKVKTFNTEEVSYVANTLRGGVWHYDDPEDTEYLPHTVVVVVDTALVQAAKLGVVLEGKDVGVRALKKKLRKQFDGGKESVIHATDNTQESWEYLSACFLEEENEVIKEVRRIAESVSPSLFDRIRLSVVLAPRMIVYHGTRFRKRVVHGALRYLMKI